MFSRRCFDCMKSVRYLLLNGCCACRTPNCVVTLSVCLAVSKPIFNRFARSSGDKSLCRCPVFVPLIFLSSRMCVAMFTADIIRGTIDSSVSAVDIVFKSIKIESRMYLSVPQKSSHPTFKSIKHLHYKTNRQIFYITTSPIQIGLQRHRLSGPFLSSENLRIHLTT